MSQGNDKDLSDLKARLGLKKKKKESTSTKKDGDGEGAGKPTARSDQATGGAGAQQQPTDGPGPGAAGQAVESRPAGGSQAASGRPGPAQGPPVGQGPPPGAAGPPGGRKPGGASSPTGRSSAGPARSGASAGASQPSRQSTGQSKASRERDERPEEDIELDDEDLAAVGEGVFSVGTILLMVFVLAVGGVVGWVASSTLNQRSLYERRTDDAGQIRDRLEENLEQVDEAQAIVDDLSEDDVDFEAAEKLASLELSPGEDLFATKQLLLGSRLVGYITGFMADAAMLEGLLEEHDRLTNDLDKEELEQLLEDNEDLEEDHFAVVFDFAHLSRTGASEDFVPKPGQIVTIPDAKNLKDELDDDGEIEVKLLNTDRTMKTRLQGLVPLDKSKIIETGGRTGLQRYQNRVRQIKGQIKKIEEYRGSMMDQLGTLADRDDPPLFSL